MTFYHSHSSINVISERSFLTLQPKVDFHYQNHYQSYPLSQHPILLFYSIHHKVYACVYVYVCIIYCASSPLDLKQIMKAWTMLLLYKTICLAPIPIHKAQGKHLLNKQKLSKSYDYPFKLCFSRIFETGHHFYCHSLGLVSN